MKVAPVGNPAPRKRTYVKNRRATVKNEPCEPDRRRRHALSPRNRAALARGGVWREVGLISGVRLKRRLHPLRAPRGPVSYETGRQGGPIGDTFAASPPRSDSSP